MNQIFLTILQMNLTAMGVILAVFVIRLLLKKAPKIFSYALWIIVLFRLVCPVALESPFGIQANSEQIISNIVNVIKQSAEKNNSMLSEQNAIDEVGIDVNQSEQKQENLLAGNTNQNLNKASHDSTQNSIIANPAFQIVKDIWFCGIVVLLGSGFFSYLNLKRKLLHAKQIENRLYEMEQLPTPFVFGIIKPCIYLPTGIAGEECEYILAHERMHIKRFDYLIKIIAFLIVIVHWVNPLVWISFFFMTKDMEMSCDEAVIRSYGAAIKKGYSTSLLHMAVQKNNLGIAPLAFGERNVKGRIKNILHYKNARIGILLLCVCVLIGTVAVLTTNRMISENQMKVSRVENMEVNTSSILQEYKLNANVKSYAVVVATYTDGQEIKRDIIASGNITNENQNGNLDISLQYTKEDNRVTVFVTDRSQSHFMTYYLPEYTMRAVNSLWENENRYHTIKMNEPYLLITEYTTSVKTNQIEVYDCEELMNSDATWKLAMEQSEAFGSSMIMVYYMISDQNADEMESAVDRFTLHSYSSEIAETEDASTLQEKTEDGTDSETEKILLLQQQIEKWAEAFCDRDGGSILSMISEEAKWELQEKALLDTAGGTISFGVSSPWPMQPENGYQIMNIDMVQGTAEILYYAMTSDPHMSVWQEKIAFIITDDKFVITGEKLNYLDSISTVEEFVTAYPEGKISGTQMDYAVNGLGETLNRNALLSSNMLYKDLFAPDTALAFLLNLQDDREKVQIDYGYLDDGTDDVFADITFTATGETITVKMTQPYGKGGIWIPQDMTTIR